MTTPAQRRANRRNAIKSTGPKTADGKLISARNATRHGLSTPINLNLLDPVTREAVAIVREEGFDEAAAQEIVLALSEHRRVMDAYAALYLELKGDFSPRPTRHPRVDKKLARMAVEGEFGADVPLSSQEIVDILNTAVLSGLPTNRTDDPKRLVALGRYQRRAAAQLSKAIRNN